MRQDTERTRIYRVMLMTARSLKLLELAPEAFVFISETDVLLSVISADEVKKNLPILFQDLRLDGDHVLICGVFSGLGSLNTSDLSRPLYQLFPGGFICEGLYRPSDPRTAPAVTAS